MSVQQYELGLASDTPGVVSTDVQSLAVSDITKNCSSSDPVEHSDSETMQCQPAVLPGLKEETPTVKDEITGADIIEKPEVKSVDDVNAVSVQVMQPSAVTSPQLMGTDVSEQLAVLHDTVRSLKMSNDELRQIVSDGMTKVGELEVAHAKSEARNKELEQKLAQLSSSTEHIVSDVALLSASLARISVRVDKPDEVKPTPAAGDSDAAAAEGIDVSSLLPMIEQRIGELELKVQQSVTRFGEFASALESIERDLQRYVRRHSLVVENLSPKEDRSASDAFLIFVNSVLGVTVDDSDIDGYHLLDRTHEDGATATNTHSPDKKKDVRPRPLLITFTCYRTRTRVYKAWLCYRVSAAGRGKAAPGLLSGERGLGVCIREYLTPSQEAIYRKADETRHRRSDVITDCWTFRGRTFVRTSQDEVHEFNESDQFFSKETKTSFCVVM